MTRHPESAGQALLFDDDLTTRVLREARDPGYVLVGIAEKVHTRAIGTRAAEMAIPARPDEAATVAQLLAAGRLHHGARVSVLIDSRREPEPATLVDATATAAATPEGPVRLLVDVVRPGLGLVTAADGTFSGSIVRQDGAYLVETEHGDVIGRASSYRVGAARLARHHNRRPGPVEIEHEREVYG
jgi:hypothetical protein